MTLLTTQASVRSTVVVAFLCEWGPFGCPSYVLDNDLMRDAFIYSLNGYY